MITLSKIAKLANVSVSTASKAFSGSKEVNEETREMIFDIAKKNDCFKKFYNVRYPKLVIAVIAPEFKSTYYTCCLSYIQNKLQIENSELCVSTTDFSEENEKALIKYYYNHSDVDGVIIIASQTDIAAYSEIPIVLINPLSKPKYGISVSSNLQPALCESIDYLISKNINSMGFIGEKLTYKKQGLFEQILKEKGITLDEAYISISDERFEEGGYRAMENLFLKHKLPRAIICAYDNMAIGAVRCIYDHGLSVPQDIAVLGMDDISEAGFLNPPLASISSKTEEICKIATETIINQIKGKNIDQHQTIDSKFILRQSFEIL